MSIAVIRAVSKIRELKEEHKPWLEIQAEVEKAQIKEAGFQPLYVGYDAAPYRLRFRPVKEPAVTSREFDEQIHRIAVNHSLKLETRCTGYFLYADTGLANGFSQKVRKSLGMTYKTKLIRVLYLDKYGIELERPEVQGAPETLEEVGTTLYGMAA